MEDQLTRHKYNVHREKKPKVTCEVCGKSFQSNAILNKHKVSHENDDEKLARSQQCEYCGEWLQSKSGIYYHEQIHTSGPQTCDQCGLVLANKIALQGHIRKAHRVAKFKCSYCDMAFTECSTLTVVFKPSLFTFKYFLLTFNIYFGIFIVDIETRRTAH